MRPQFTLLGVATADQHKTRRVAHRQAFTLDKVFASSRNINQKVDQMVFNQVDFIDVQKAAVGTRQQAGLEGLDTLRLRTLQVRRAHHAVLGGAQRQVHHRHRHQVRLGLHFACSFQRRTFAALAER